MSVTTNHVFLAFSQQIDRSRVWLSDRFVDACGYPKSVWLDRIAQRLVESGLPAYARAVDARIKRHESPFPPDDAVIDVGDACISVGSGRVAVSAARLLRSEWEFLLHWAYALGAIVAGSWTRRVTTSAVLVFDLAESDVLEDNSDARFVAFCRTGPVSPLRDGQRRLIEAETAVTSTVPEEFAYCRYPLAELVKEARLGAAERISMFFRHLALFWTYHLAIARTPQLALVAKELAYRAVAATLDGRGVLRAVVMTCSSYRHQPIWARGLSAPTHMVWYAQNWKPTVKTSNDIESDYPTTRWIRADVHWVWTEAFATYLRSMLPGDVRVAGPLLWRLPETGVPDASIISIVVFDVPAVSDQVMLDLNGEVTNYFHPANLRVFIRDIIDVRARLERDLGQRVVVSLKMKRGFRPDYSRDYFDDVETLARQRVIDVVPQGQSLFQVISQTRLVIAYPFTSPAYVAEYLGVPAIYYDATHGIQRGDFADDKAAVSFAVDPQELHRLALAALQSRPADAGLRTPAFDR